MRAVLIALSLVVISAAPPAMAKGLKDLVTTFSLDNGMDVVVIEDHRAPVVVHMLWYRAGSADEWTGVSGVAHFLEHLLFKGTKTLEPGEFSKTVAANGGYDNAFTSYDYTGYFQRVAADRLELMMKMEADRMVNIQLSEEEIVTERDVILEERNSRVENDPNSLFREQLRAAQYLNHRYGAPVIGWRHEMEELSREDALAFYDLHYSPNNTILIVAGDVTPEQVEELAKKHYGPIPANPALPAERLRPSEPPQIAARRLVYEDARVAQPYIQRSYLAPERDSGAQEKAAALTVLAEVLGGSQTSVLAQKLQFETSTAVYAGAYYGGTSLDSSTFNLIMVPSQGVSLQEGEESMDRVIAEFIETGVDADQLSRIKAQMRASQIYAQDNVQSVARQFGDALTSGLTIQDILDWPDVVDSVTAEDVIAAAKEVFDMRQSVTGWLTTPKGEAQ